MDEPKDTGFSGERKRGQHLRLEERGAIEHLRKAGFSLRAIGSQLQVSASTVWNELRCGTPEAKGQRGRRVQATRPSGWKIARLS